MLWVYLVFSITINMSNATNGNLKSIKEELKEMMIVNTLGWVLMVEKLDVNGRKV